MMLDSPRRRPHPPPRPTPHPPPLPCKLDRGSRQSEKKPSKLVSGPENFSWKGSGLVKDALFFLKMKCKKKSQHSFWCLLSSSGGISPSWWITHSAKKTSNSGNSWGNHLLCVWIVLFQRYAVPIDTLDGCNLEVPQGTLLKLYLLWRTRFYSLIPKKEKTHKHKSADQANQFTKKFLNSFFQFLYFHHYGQVITVGRPALVPGTNFE